jgi:hypothetical protein
MSCNCNEGPIQSWIDWRTSTPKNPLDLIAYATFDGTVGSYSLSTTYAPTGGAWQPNTWSINGSIVCAALGTDNIQKVANADQWNFAHQTQAPYSNPAPPLSKVIFLRGGTEWIMTIPINMAACSDLQLSFRDNAGTRGDAQGTIPVLLWSGAIAGATHVLKVTLKTTGQVVMGLKATDTGSGQPTMYESEWIIVP